MVILGKWKQFSVSLRYMSNVLTISLQSKDSASRVYSFDASGRLWTAMVAGVSYRRGLNGKTVAKWQTASTGGMDAPRERRWLSPGEAAELQEEARQTSVDLYRALLDGEVSLSAPADGGALPPNYQPLFEKSIDFRAVRYEQDVQHYHQVYKPVGILPPDQYMAVVLQATEGCSFNTCTFCNFYRDRRFRIKPSAEFREHALAVRDFLGAGLSLRRTLFLGDANALVIPMPRLLELLEITRQVYDVDALGGIYAFLDGFSGEKKTVEDYKRLRELGMRRIYVGLESGSAGLLKLLKKPGKPEDAIQAVRAIKAAGIGVGVIVLLGAGGQAYARDHVRDTIRSLNEMKLGLDDLIYFSELVESEGMEYTRDAYQQQLKPLSPAERIAQGEAIERGLVFQEESGVPHISRYDIREFVY
jgi:hypothetical protein